MAKTLERMGPPSDRKGLKRWKKQQKGKHMAIQKAFTKEEKWRQYEGEDEKGRKRLLLEIIGM